MKRYKLTPPESIKWEDGRYWQYAHGLEGGTFDANHKLTGGGLAIGNLPPDWLEEVEPEIDWSQVENQTPIDWVNEDGKVLTARFVEVLKGDRVLIFANDSLMVLHSSRIYYAKHFKGGREAWIKEFMPTIQEVAEESMEEATCHHSTNHLIEKHVVNIAEAGMVIDTSCSKCKFEGEHPVCVECGSDHRLFKPKQP